MDKILINEIDCWARIGVPHDERNTPQRLLVDLCIEADLRRPARSDKFEETIDYHSIVEKAQRIASSSSFSLIEALAGEICLDLLKDSRIAALEITVRKFPESLRDKIASVAVVLRRENPNYPGDAGRIGLFLDVSKK